MKKIKQAINRLICRIIGHKECWVLTKRTRTERKNGTWKNAKVKMVRGVYKECARCGKKLSNFERI